MSNIKDKIYGSTIIIHKKDTPYVQLSKDITNGGGGFSLKALGLLCYLLGKPDGWQTWVTDIATRFSDGESAVRSGLAELRLLGYADLEPIKTPTGFGGSVWRISDEPMFKDLERTKQFRLRQKKSPKTPLMPEITVSSNSGDLKLRKPEIQETRVSGNHHLSKKRLYSKEPEACSPRLRRVKQQQQQEAAAIAADAAALPLTGLTEKAKDLKAAWSQHYCTAFGAKPKFSPEDDAALNEFVELVPGTLREQMALVIMAWSIPKWDNTKDFNRQFHCNAYSSLPVQWVNRCRCRKCTLPVYMTIINELGWRSRPDNIQKAYDWLAIKEGQRKAAQKGVGDQTDGSLGADQPR